jgi:ATP-dependent Lon protease
MQARVNRTALETFHERTGVCRDFTHLAITLRGRVLPVGGVKMKVLAVHRAGLHTVIVPKWNARDLDELPEDVRQSMTFISVEMIDEVLHASLGMGTGTEGS